MASKADPIPERMSIAEAGEFWDTHSIADYPTKLVDLEFEPQGRTTLVAVEDGLLRRLKARAGETGVSVETLVNLWLQERLTVS